MKAASGIYFIRCNGNGKVYVGSSKNLKARFTRHFVDLRAGQHHCVPMQRAWNKYGDASFEMEIQCVGFSVEELLFMEQAYLDAMLASGVLFNTCLEAGTCKGVSPSAASNEKRVAALRGSKRTPEQCARISAAKRLPGGSSTAAAIAASAEKSRFRLSETNAQAAREMRLLGVSMENVALFLRVSIKPLRRALYARFPDLASLKVYTRPACYGPPKPAPTPKRPLKPWLAEANKRRAWTDEMRKKVADAQRRTWRLRSGNTAHGHDKGERDRCEGVSEQPRGG